MVVIGSIFDIASFFRPRFSGQDSFSGGDGGGVVLGRGGRGGAEAAEDRDGGGVLIGDGGGRAVTIKDSIKDLSKLTLFFLLIFDGGGYLSGEDVRSGGGGSDNEKIFWVYKEEEE